MKINVDQLRNEKRLKGVYQLLPLEEIRKSSQAALCLAGRTRIFVHETFSQHSERNQNSDPVQSGWIVHITAISKLGVIANDGRYAQFAASLQLQGSTGLARDFIYGRKPLAGSGGPPRSGEHPNPPSSHHHPPGNLSFVELTSQQGDLPGKKAIFGFLDCDCGLI